MIRFWRTIAWRYSPADGDYSNVTRTKTEQMTEEDRLFQQTGRRCLDERLAKVFGNRASRSVPFCSATRRIQPDHI
jgi:hypothetical protein